MLSTRHKATIAVAAAISYFSSRGYGVFLPIGETGGAIDLIVSSDGIHLVRIQCKYTGRKRTKKYIPDKLIGRKNKYTPRRKRKPAGSLSIWEVGLFEPRRPLKDTTIWMQHFYDNLSFDMLFVQTPESTYLIPWQELCHQRRTDSPDTPKLRRVRLGQSMDQYRLKDPLMADPSIPTVSHTESAM